MRDTPALGADGSVNGTRSTALIALDGELGIVLADNPPSRSEPSAETRTVCLVCSAR